MSEAVATSAPAVAIPTVNQIYKVALASIIVKSLMTPENFTDWGWRIFFVIGFLVAIVGHNHQ